MSDLEQDSRTSAVGRKRNRPGKSSLPSSAASQAGGGTASGSRGNSRKEQTSRRSSLESGEISSAGERRSPSPEVYDKWGPDFIPISFQVPKRRRLTASPINSVFDEDRSAPNVVSVAESSEAESPSPEPHAMGRSPNLEGTRLCDLSYQDVVQQELYFDLDLEKYPDDLCYCLCCGGRGHMASACSETTCEHCGAKESHASYACPTYRKCRLCRTRGHDPTECTNPAKDSDSDSCDICHDAGHAEEQCPRLWNTSLHPDPTEKVRKIHDKHMIRACYSCGSDDHWGDDCQYRDRYVPRSFVKTWSKIFADQFVIEHDSRVETVTETSATEKQPQANAETRWQSSMLDDGRD